MPPPFTDSKLINAQLFDLSPGVFYDRHPMDIPLGGASAVNNLVWVDGYVRPRPGLTEAYPVVDSNQVVHLSQFVPLIGSVRLMRVSVTASTTMHVHYYTASMGWQRVTPIGGIAAALDPTDTPKSVNFKGRWYIAPGAIGIYEYDGTTFQPLVTGITDDTKKPFDVPKFLAATESRLFLANCLDNFSGGTRVPYRVAWCDFNNPKVWSTGSATGNGSARFIDLPNDSEPITGLYAGPNSTLLVFKARQVLLGEDVGSPLFWDFRMLQRGPGCVSAATIKEWRNGNVLCLGDDNVYIQVPGQIPQPVGDRIRPRLSQLAVAVDLRKSRAWIDRDNDLYTLVIPESSGASAGKVLRTFTLSLRNGGWWEGVYSIGTDQVTDAYEFRDGVWQSKELIATEQGHIYESTFGVTTDAGNAIPTSWTSGVIRIPQLSGNQTEQASLQKLRIYAASGAVNMGAYWGDNLDRFNYKDFGSQVIDGVAQVYCSERATAENFMIFMGTNNASNSPKVAGLGASLILEGGTR